jgi:hypothetical protein
MKLKGNMRKAAILLSVCFVFFNAQLQAQPFRTTVEGSIEITPERPAGGSVTVGINSSVLISLGQEARFLRGIEFEITAPQAWLSYRGSLAIAAYNNISPQTPSGISDITGAQINLEPLAPRLQIIYQLPVRQAHGLRTTTSVNVLGSPALPSTFPIIFRLMPVIKGLNSELENMTFSLTARPILSDEGAVRLIIRYPPQLRNRPFTVLIDDNVINNITEQVILREGEHHLVIISEDYRNESRRFVVERAKAVDLTIDLADTTPIIVFEGPENAVIYLNNSRIPQNRAPVTVEPGVHEVRFQIGDYTVIQTINVLKGKTYRVSLLVDLTIHEED